MAVVKVRRKAEKVRDKAPKLPRRSHRSSRFSKLHRPSDNVNVSNTIFITDWRCTRI